MNHPFTKQMTNNHTFLDKKSASSHFHTWQIHLQGQTACLPARCSTGILTEVTLHPGTLVLLKLGHGVAEQGYYQLLQEQKKKRGGGGVCFNTQCKRQELKRHINMQAAICCWAHSAEAISKERSRRRLSDPLLPVRMNTAQHLLIFTIWMGKISKQ